MVRRAQATPISSIFVKPDGRARSSIKGDTNRLTPADVDFTAGVPQVVLFDGHQPALALSIAAWAEAHGIPTVLDADTVNEGNVELSPSTHLVAASECFAYDYSGAPTPEAGMARWPALACRSGHHE